MTAPIVFIDFAGPDDKKLRAFYMNVFGWKFDAKGMVDLHFPSPSINGAVRKDPAEKRVYLGVPDVTNALASIEAHGGSIDQPRFEVPGVVILGLFRDPAANPMGLVEMDGDQRRIP